MAAGVAYILWWVPYVGLRNIHSYLPTILGSILGLVVLAVFVGSLLLILTILAGRDFFLSKKLRGAVVKVLFPLLIVMGKIFGISRETISHSFVAINNQLVLAQNLRAAPSRLLLLMPHCLQNHDCKVKITGNVENCEGCGKCPIKELLALSRKYGVELAVATGGTIARRLVVQKRPKLIIAVACERDLTSGIQDTYPLPVYGIFNRRPYGPCFNTGLPLEEVEMAIRHFSENSDS
ncbi:MAG: DUF116 domain-containing protein [Deltaproteobacteria bacterium]|nr:MAG: DUF116 domain-containing protein [Deltaproteobacteria bacterium]